MKLLEEKYFACCDRLYLNKLSQRKVSDKSRVYQDLQEQIDKDNKLKKELESKLGIRKHTFK